MSVEIMNMALDLLKEEPILSETDNRAPVRWMRRNYAPTRDALIRKHPWNCAKARAILPAMTEAPAFGWAFFYQIPDDCLRVLPLADLGKFNGVPVPFEVEARRILTSAKAPLKVIYLRVIERDDMDALFVQALAATLAAKAAHFITGKQSMTDRAGQIAREAVLEAQMVDGLEGTPENIWAGDWESARAGYDPTGDIY